MKTTFIEKQIIKKTTLKKAALALALISVCALFGGCATSGSLNAPCPNYGATCARVPVNSWAH